MVNEQRKYRARKNAHGRGHVNMSLTRDEKIKVAEAELRVALEAAIDEKRLNGNGDFYCWLYALSTLYDGGDVSVHDGPRGRVI